MNNKTIYYSIALISILLSIFFLTNIQHFTTDDEHILSSRIISLAFDKEINDNRVLGNTRIFSYSNLPEKYSKPSLSIEPLQTIIGSFFAELSAAMNFGRVQTLFTINIWAISITAVLIYLTIIQQGFSHNLAFISGLIFGLTTMVWPYTRSIFRDPLAMMMSTFCLYFLTCLNNKKIGKFSIKQFVFILLIILFFILSIFTKNILFSLFPVICIGLLIAFFRDSLGVNKRATIFHIVLMFLLSLVVISILLFLLNLLSTQSGLFSRFSFTYFTEVINIILKQSHTNFITGFTGILLSPGKSLFLYNPILLFSIYSLFKFFSKAWLPWLYFLLLCSFQLLFYDTDWWGHINWGLRFILPAIPPLLISCAPVFSKLLSSIRGKLILFFIICISLFIQTIGIYSPIKQYYIDLTNLNPNITVNEMIWLVKFSPLLWHLRQFIKFKIPEITIFRIGENGIPLMLGFIFIIAFSCISLIWIKNNYMQISLFILLIILSFLYLNGIKTDGLFPPRKDLDLTQKIIQNSFSSNDQIIIASYGTPVWDYWMNWGNPGLPWTSLPLQFSSMSLFDKRYLDSKSDMVLDEITLKIIRDSIISKERIWFVYTKDSILQYNSLISNYLENNSMKASRWFFSDNDHYSFLYLFEGWRLNKE